MTRLIWTASIAAIAAFGLGATLASAERYRDRQVPIEAVETLDLERYLGCWHEIARFPNRFEKGCEGVTAEYSLREDGNISVLNSCREGAPDGPLSTAEGKAWVVEGGQLKVTFVPWLPFARGDYWVLWIDEAYSVVAIGNPAGRTGWILARDPVISESQRAAAEAALAQNGYDIDKLYDVAQPPL
ncbi:lipocalin family protein [Shimia marina]|uniref:Outer membrane lipoprotein Blc n=1 Tax=Shimia marina TaxID=321267 RepID=A0A0N7LSC1_9RHOB|nr:lipocalin family protein [Shimia marina]CUH53204.1 Outer membrane lipoprotein blc precursor [Shimia marina]SFD82498.1 apolipoprotein D and lipocalin family protein [Shimia marina]